MHVWVYPSARVLASVWAIDHEAFIIAFHDFAVLYAPFLWTRIRDFGRMASRYVWRQHAEGHWTRCAMWHVACAICHVFGLAGTGVDTFKTSTSTATKTSQSAPDMPPRPAFISISGFILPPISFRLPTSALRPPPVSCLPLPPCLIQIFNILLCLWRYRSLSRISCHLHRRLSELPLALELQLVTGNCKGGLVTGIAATRRGLRGRQSTWPICRLCGSGFSALGRIQTTQKRRSCHMPHVGWPGLGWQERSKFQFILA